MINVVADFLGISYGQNIYSDSALIVITFLLSVTIVVAIIDMICNIIKSIIGK